MPHFQGHHLPTMDSAARAEKLRPDLAAKHAAAVEDMKERYAEEKAARIH
jgi:limonene 1,2-monooxygenase